MSKLLTKNDYARILQKINYPPADKIRALCDIPNVAGYKLMALFADGGQLPAQVVKTAGGWHSLDIVQSGAIEYSKLTGWKFLFT